VRIEIFSKWRPLLDTAWPSALKPNLVGVPRISDQYVFIPTIEGCPRLSLGLGQRNHALLVRQFREFAHRAWGRPTHEAANGIPMYGVSTSVRTPAVMEMVKLDMARAPQRTAVDQEGSAWARASLSSPCVFSTCKPKPFAKRIPGLSSFKCVRTPFTADRHGDARQREDAECNRGWRKVRSGSRLARSRHAGRVPGGHLTQVSRQAGSMPDWIARVSCSRPSPFRSRCPDSQARRRARHE
jgi:hypothetical protein